MKKFCHKCKNEKELSFFSKDSTKKDGLQCYCKNCRKQIKNIWRLSNKECINKYSREYLVSNPDKRKKYYKRNAEYRKENRIKIRKYQKNYLKNRRETDSLFLLRRNISTLIRNYFKQNNHKKQSKTQTILGCTFQEFKDHIEKQFESWMSWENYGKYNREFNYGWDLDHIIPVSIAKTEEELIQLNNYINYQPLCSKVNREIKQNNIQ